MVFTATSSFCSPSDDAERHLLTRAARPDRLADRLDLADRLTVHRDDLVALQQLAGGGLVLHGGDHRDDGGVGNLELGERGGRRVVLRVGHLDRVLLLDLLLRAVGGENGLLRHHGHGRIDPAAQRGQQVDLGVGPALVGDGDEPQLTIGRVRLPPADHDHRFVVHLAEGVLGRAGTEHDVRHLRQRPHDPEGEHEKGRNQQGQGAS
jgi:hypothetical protein